MSNAVFSGVTRFAPEGNLFAGIYNWILNLKRGRALLFAFGMGAIANLSFAPVYLWPVMAISLSSLIWLLDGATLQAKPRASAFWRGLSFAFGQFSIGFHWVAFAFLVDPARDFIFIWLSLLLPAGLAVIWGGVIWALIHVWPRGPARAVMAALAIFIAEWMRGHLFGGFPWNIPTMIWAPGGAVSQSVALFGAWGLSLLTVLLCAAPAALCDMRLKQGNDMLGRAIPVIAAVMVFGMLWGWGSNRLASGSSEVFGPSVRLVDVGTPQGEKTRDRTAAGRMLNRYLTLTGPDTPNNPDIVIWPEGAIPVPLAQRPDALEPVAEFLGSRRLLVGTVYEYRQTHPVRWHNALVVLTQDSSIKGPEATYFKHRLVPVGEMVPFRDIMSKIGIRALQQIATSGFYPGQPPDYISVEGVPDFQPLICYEALFPGLLPKRKLASSSRPGEGDRADWIVNISIDAWFGPLWAPKQHLEHARYRAIEEGLPMVRVASRGISGVVDAYGRITKVAEPVDEQRFGADPPGWKGRVVDAQIPAKLASTMYSRTRELILLGLILAVVVFGVILPRN